MITGKSQLVQYTWAAIALVLVFSALSMIWPGIIAVSLGVLLLLQSVNANQELALLSCGEVGHLPIVFSSLRRSGLPAIFS
ncbi:MAG: hypothetical protein OEV99_03610 [Nitrospira sp.]|nr:hypothetical protein [Nitrospira sp.]MDH4368907.1 hypothetical protein [Nitrospira sp.]MDH5496762.1 hypothetical protein [Nitrospira sp.]MDH5724513.1 hypothetical protein [Nitrospira sp.]